MIDDSYGLAALAMMCPACKARLEEELNWFSYAATKNPVKALRQANRLIGVINKVCCQDCLDALQTEGVRWAHDHPEEIDEARKDGC